MFRAHRPATPEKKGMIISLMDPFQNQIFTMLILLKKSIRQGYKIYSEPYVMKPKNVA